MVDLLIKLDPKAVETIVLLNPAYVDESIYLVLCIVY
jgi:hypothetical protein